MSFDFNFIHLSKDGIILDRNIKRLVMGSSGVDLLYIISDFDTESGQTPYRCSIRFKRSDKMLLGPFLAPQTIIPQELKERLNVDYDYCRVYTFESKELEESGPLNITFAYQTVDEQGNVLTTRTQGEVVFNVAQATPKLAQEDEINRWRSEFLPRDFGDLGQVNSLNETDTFSVRQGNVTKKVSKKDFFVDLDNYMNEQGSVKELKDELGGLVNDGIIQGLLETDIENKLNKLEQDYSPRLTSIENTKANKTYVDNIIQSIASGSPKGVFNNLLDLQNSIPSGDDNIYITSSDGNWNYWNGINWVGGGIYQSNGIARKSIGTEKISFYNDIVGKNLFNKESVVPDGYLGSSGQVVSNSSFAISDFIDINGVTHLSYSYNQNIKNLTYYAFYDIDKIIIPETYATVSPSPLEVPINAKYIRISVRKENLETAQLEIGKNISGYENFIVKYRTDESISLGEFLDDIQKNKVLPNHTVFFDGEKSRNLFNKAAAIVGYYLVAGEYIKLSNWFVSDYIDISNNTNLSFQVDGKRANLTYYAFYDSNKAIISSSSSSATPLEIPSNANFLKFSYYLDKMGTVQLEGGENVTPFVNYGDKFTLKDSLLPEWLTNKLTELPLEEVISKSINMFDKNKVFDGLITKTQIYNYPTYKHSDFITVKPNTYYCWNVRDAISNAGVFYGENKEIIGDISPLFQNGKQFSIIKTPSNCRYVKVNILSMNVDSCMFVEGDSYPSKYVGFGYTLNEKKITNYNNLNENYEPISVTKKDNNVLVRVDWDDSFDLIYSMDISGSANGSFNIVELSTIEKQLPKNTPSNINLGTGEEFKVISDDICPLSFNDGHIGANHGWAGVKNINTPNHGKTTKDIGSTWFSNNGKVYTIIRIIDSDNIQLVALSQENYRFFDDTDPTFPITHIEGATNTSDINGMSVSRGQLYPSINNVEVEMFINGNVKLTDNGVIGCDFFDVVEKYDILDGRKVVEYFQQNVGVDSNGIIDDSFSDACATISITYRFTQNGAITVYQNCEFHKEVKLNYAGFVQSAKIGELMYVPNTNSYKNLHNQGGVLEQIRVDDLIDNLNLPHRYYQFSNDMSKGMTLGYCPEYGFGKNETRLNYVENTVGNYASTGKMYPYIITKQMIVGTDFMFDAISYRIPFKKIDDDATSVVWYWVGDQIYLMIDVHKNINKTIKLPKYMNSMKIEIVEKTPSFIVQQSFIGVNGLKIIVNDNYGYAILKLSK